MTIILPTAAQRIERQKLCESVAETIKTYREGEIEQRTAEHVDRWLSQFTPENQLEFLREFDHVLAKTYISKEMLVDWFKRGIRFSGILKGRSPQDYWSSACFLDLQEPGHSQHELRSLFLEIASEELGTSVSGRIAPGGDYFYLDDAIFTARTATEDLAEWIKSEAPDECRLHLMTAVKHTFGKYKLEEELNKLIEDLGKEIELLCWGAIGYTFENRNYHSHNSRVLWPKLMPSHDDVETYKSQRATPFKFSPRKVYTDGRKPVDPFLTEAGRHLMEQELLLAGAKIVNACSNPKKSMKPLGFGNFEVGFGSLVVTYRNCPNNCPLAMWWGDEDATSGALAWYPLLPRKGYSDNDDDFIF